MMLKFEGANRYLDEKRQLKKVFENVPVQDLSLDKYDNSIVFYTELNDLQEVLEGLILHHNYVPTKIKHKRFHIVRIVFEKEGRYTILTVDVNHGVHPEICYKDIIKLCEAHEVEFKNQSIGALVAEIRSAFYNPTHKRVRFTKKQRNELHLKFLKCCNSCKKELPAKLAHIDHVKPLAAGGTNDEANLQILCRECHFEKSQAEMLNHEYVRTSATASSYNAQTLEIVTSREAGVYPFIEALVPPAPAKEKLFTLDLIRSRKNAIYYSKFDFPLFTVMDQPVALQGDMSHTKPGLYYVRSNLYFPIRGDGWYSHAMVSYLLEKKLILRRQITHVVYSSLRVPRDHFNDFIDATYALKDGYEKFKINCMIGLFKPSAKQHYKSLAISTDPNAIYYH